MGETWFPPCDGAEGGGGGRLKLAVYLWRYVLAAFFPPASCKYHPSCSQYALDAVHKHGVVKGSAKAGWRLLRCNPWSRGGVDYA